MDQSFSSLGVPAHLVERLARSGIVTPTPVQAATLPDALAGRDVCGRAPTGTGKTIAFGLPLVLRAARPTGGRAPRGLVLVPTRELALQVHHDLVALEPSAKDRIISIYGGVGYGPQRQSLRRGAAIVVACPGRLEDLIERGDLRLDAVTTVVVDEADRMADMGFLPAVKRILGGCAAERQTMLFSATLDPAVSAIVKHYMSDPVLHEVVAPEDSVGDVEHVFRSTGRAERAEVTARLVAEHGRAIVFCRTRHGADRLARQLDMAGVLAAPLHGNRTQAQRERALRAFGAGRVKALVATDVAARGIHVADVSCVVHFDPAGSATDYVHRSGRTGRAGATGTVVSLVLPEQEKETAALKRALGFASSKPERGRRPAAPPERRPQRPNRPGARHGRPVGRALRSR
jgi:superfamily II DNA/RNA helicase